MEILHTHSDHVSYNNAYVLKQGGIGRATTKLLDSVLYIPLFSDD